MNYQLVIAGYSDGGLARSFMPPVEDLGEAMALAASCNRQCSYWSIRHTYFVVPSDEVDALFAEIAALAGQRENA
jgi:hypothetical protein